MRVLRPGDTFTRTARPFAISQSEFHERARGVIWNTADICYDERGEYFAPVDFDAPTSSHLNTRRMFAELGVRFDEVEGPPSKYLVDHDRLFIPDFPLA